ncbi:MAG: hypothetical protein KDA98_17710, partial [Acidimicrobiales bacterium]|nr:hypothetical protein [Acidimicrobiales bacterium]
ADEPISVVTARLAVATAGSGVALAVDGDDAWQLAVAPGLGELRVYRVVDGVPEQRGTLAVAVADGSTIGLFLRDERVGVLVDGEQRAIEGFFGVELDLDADGTTPGAAAFVAGSDRPAVAELAIG